MINSLPAIWAVRAILIPVVSSLAPSIISPLVSTDLNYSFVLESSAFSLLDPEDSHEFTWWELSTLSDFSVIEKSSTSSLINKTDWTVSGLLTNTTYYARVRYSGGSLPMTNWSNTFVFNTKNVIDTSTTWIFDDFNGPAGSFENHLTAEGYGWASFEAFNSVRINDVALNLDGLGNAVSNNALNKSVYNSQVVEGETVYAEFNLCDGVVTTPVPESNYYVEIAFHAPATSTLGGAARRSRVSLMARIQNAVVKDQPFVDYALVFSNTELILWIGGGDGWSGTLVDPVTGASNVSPILITQLPYDISVAKDYVFRIEVEGIETRAYLNNIHVATRCLYDSWSTSTFQDFINQKYVGFAIVSNHEWVIHKTEPLADYFHSDPYTIVPIDDPYIGSFEPSSLNLKIAYFKAGSLTSNRTRHWVYDDFDGLAGSIENHLTVEGYKWAPFQFTDNTRTISGSTLDIDGLGNARPIVDIENGNSTWCDGVPMVTLPDSDYYAEVAFSAPETTVLDIWRKTRICLMLRIKTMPDPIYGRIDGNSFIDYDFVFSDDLSTNTNIVLQIGNMGGQITGSNISLPVLRDPLDPLGLPPGPLGYIYDGPEFKEYVFRVEVQGAEARAYINNNLISTNVIDVAGWGVEILDARHAGFAIISETQNATGRNWEPFVHYFKVGPLNDVPRITFPLISLDLDYTFSLTSSPAVNFNSSASHVSSDWEISLLEDFSVLVQSIYNSTANKRSWVVSNLAPNTLHVVRVRYNYSDLTSSEWSEFHSYTTKI